MRRKADSFGNMLCNAVKNMRNSLGLNYESLLHR